MALNSLLCADVPLRNYSITHPHPVHRSTLVLTCIECGEKLQTSCDAPDHDDANKIQDHDTAAPPSDCSPANVL